MEGLRIVELCDDPGGEMVGKMLALAGADVVKVEPPGGSASRRVGPFVDDEPGVERSLSFRFYNTNKRSVVIDLGTGTGTADLHTLLADTDVLVTTLTRAEAASTGIDYEQLLDTFLELIVVTVTAFGLDGPWADRRSSDLVGLALGGPLNSCGYDDHTIPPIRPGGDQGYQSAASHGQIGLLLALLERQRSGRGQLVDVAMHDCLAVGGELANPYWFYPKALVQRQTCRHAQPAPTQPSIFRCADNRWVYLVTFIADDKQWTTLIEWLLAHDLAAGLDGPTWRDKGHRQANMDHVQTIFECFFSLIPAEQAYREGQERKLPIGVINAPEDVLQDAHLRSRGFFDEVPSSVAERPAVHPRSPFRFSAVTTRPVAPAPTLGSSSLQSAWSLDR